VLSFFVRPDTGDGLSSTSPIRFVHPQSCVLRSHLAGTPHDKGRSVCAPPLPLACSKMAPGGRPALEEDADALHESRLAGLRLVRRGALTTAAFAQRFRLSYSKARRFILRDGALRKPGPGPFFTPDEEGLLVKYLVINASIGRGLSQEALSRVCALYLSELSAERQAAARARFNGSLSPGRSWVMCFLGRHPQLRRYRVGTMEHGRALNSRPDVVAGWYALLSLMYRDYSITSPRQVWNMDETHIHARTSAIAGRSEIIGDVVLTKPENILPPFASGEGACTAAFCVSAGGLVAPHFVVVDGQVPGHAFVSVTQPDGSTRDEALAAHLNDGAIVWRRSPPGFTKAVFDVWAEQFANFLRARTTRRRPNCFS